MHALSPREFRLLQSLHHQQRGIPTMTLALTAEEYERAAISLAVRGLAGHELDGSSHVARVWLTAEGRRFLETLPAA